MSPHDPRHGTNRGYIVGCRDECCTAAHRRYMKLYRMGRRPRLVDPTGTVRRVQALLAIGWTCADLGRRCGRGDEWARMVARSNAVTTETAALVKAAYDDLSMRIPRGQRHEQTRRWYANKGYAPPLAWDDDTIDNPTALPVGVGFTHVADRAGALRDLDRHHAGITTACRDLGVTRSALEKWCQRNDMGDLYRRLVRREQPNYERYVGEAS